MNEIADNILRLDSLSFGYGHKPIVSDVSLTIDAPMVVALIGPNGAGKSTLLKTISGELKPQFGDVYLQGRSLHTYTRKEISQVLSLVTTDVDSLTGGLKVEELVSLGRQPYTGFFGHLGTADKIAVHDAMEYTGISHKADSYVANLSDGERQKAMIARALAQDTPIMLLDEPFSFLDPAARIEIFMMLHRQASENGKLIILSTHDVAQALRMADCVWMIGNNSFAHSSVGDIIKSADLEALFHANGTRFSSDLGDFVPKNFDRYDNSDK